MKKILLIVALFAFIASSASASISFFDDNSTVLIVKADNDKDPDKDKDKDKDKNKKKDRKAKSKCSTKCATKCSHETKKSCCPGHAIKDCKTTEPKKPKS